MKTNLDGKVPKWVIWIMAVYSWTVIGGIALMLFVHFFFVPIMLDIIFGQPRCLTTMWVCAGLIISAVAVSNLLYGTEGDDTITTLTPKRKD